MSPFVALCKKEIMRVLKIYNQTVLAPIINSLLFISIFNVAIGKTQNEEYFVNFIASGIIMMSVIQHSFMNGSSPIVMSKVLGSIVDYLLPPFSPTQIIMSLVIASIFRSIMILVTTTVAIKIFYPVVSISSPISAVVMVVMCAMLCSLMGILSALKARTFDDMAAISNYIITPLSFLSGTFYSTSQLPEFWQNVSKANPFGYLIQNFRACFAFNELPISVLSILALALLIVALFLAAQHLMNKGYGIKN